MAQTQIPASQILDGSIKNADIATDANIEQSKISNLTSDLSSKQVTLVSGTNIKTINNTSLLGGGNITVSASALPLYSQANLSLDGANGEYFSCEISANASFSLANIATGKFYYVRIKNTSAGSIILTFPTTNTIKALATVTMTAGYYRECSIFYDGTNYTWQISGALS